MAGPPEDRPLPSIWPWIVGLIVLGLLAWVAAEMISGIQGAADAPSGALLAWTSSLVVTT